MGVPWLGAEDGGRSTGPCHARSPSSGARWHPPGRAVCRSLTQVSEVQVCFSLDDVIRRQYNAVMPTTLVSQYLLTSKAT